LETNLVKIEKNQKAADWVIYIYRLCSIVHLIQ